MVLGLTVTIFLQNCGMRRELSRKHGPPDINPIDILWTRMKNEIAARRPKVTNVKQLT